MPVPDFQSLMLPVLKAFADGETPLSEARERNVVAQGDPGAYRHRQERAGTASPVQVRAVERPRASRDSNSCQ
ncbi:MAG: hypothetical protein F4213_00100 [Boseongicola sp. SB0677_bin_26]|nr:hypothetical protein [Boseongicola sp. SB0665_bin_10]MYG24417.1 hypothetical protein [Boseongicola sp. SB0677_bin_26]